MKFAENLYVSEELTKRLPKIKRALNENRFLPLIHVITLPLSDDGQLEIYPAYIVRQSLYARENLRVIGIAGDYFGAFSLMQTIVEDCLEKTGEVDLRRFLWFE